MLPASVLKEQKRVSLNRLTLLKFYGSPKGNRTPVFAVRGRYPRPLDDGTVLAGGEGFEPSLTGPEPAVLPLNDPPALCSNLAKFGGNVKGKKGGGKGEGKGREEHWKEGGSKEWVQG